MKKLVVLVSGIALCSCAKESSVSETIADNAINATTALEQSLPESCKVDNVKTQIALLKSEIRSISQACETEKDILNHEKLHWKYAFWGLILVIGAYLIRKILK